MSEEHRDLPQKPLDIVPFASIERARASFPPELQNAMAALLAALEPISVELLTHFATNPEGKKFGNQVEVREDDVRLLIATIQAAEKKFGVTLLEMAKIGKLDESDKIEPGLVAAPTAMANLEFGYRMKPEFQKWVEKNYPQLHQDVHAMVADTMWEDIFGDEEPENPVAEKSGDNLLPGDSRLSELLDGAAKNALDSSKTS